MTEGIEIGQEDANVLFGSLKSGESVLFLGAGASASSTLPNGDFVKQSSALAELLAARGGLPYGGEDLPDVIGAVVGPRISRDQFHTILRQQYTKVLPSRELQDLFGYSWKRAYTWNIDDSVENGRPGVQKRRYINGISDKVSSYDGIEFLQFVHLHGEALKTEHGFIFSQAEYNDRLNRDSHDWYRQASSDYVSSTPIFIGSRLKEPILAAELDRARPNPDSGLGLAFLVTPDNLTPVQIANYRARNIVILKGRLDNFVNLLREKVGSRVAPLDVGNERSVFTQRISRQLEIGHTDLDTARQVVLHTWKDAKARADALSREEKQRMARAYLEGMPPRWLLAASDIPVWLQSTEELYSAISRSFASRERVFVVTGQSGSGKTTALMQCLLRYSRENEGAIIYELRSDVSSLRSALNLIHRLHKDQHVIVYLADAFAFGDSLAEDILALPSGAMTVVSSARSGEWREHIERIVGDISTAFKFERFVSADYPELLKRLVAYVPAPRFIKMTEKERMQRLEASKSQLLIALREVTEAVRFSDVITNEYRDLPDDDCRDLLLICGIATIARTGISAAGCREAYDHVRRKRPFDKAVSALDGIVFPGGNSRFVARHELYVRHIIENVVNFSLVADIIIEILRTYTKYEMPIVKNVGRLDGLLFKFLLNHNFIAEIAKRRGAWKSGLEVYKAFEIEFQLDGHYWLQYGQYLVEMGELEEALTVLNKSIQAYPQNSYAAHAYADLQLRVAARRPSYDATTVELIAEAVKTLEEQHARRVEQYDQYPIVTLAEQHIGALIKHGQDKIARAAATRYFSELESIVKRGADAPVKKAREKLAHYITFGVWDDPPVTHNRQRQRPRRRGSRRQ